MADKLDVLRQEFYEHKEKVELYMQLTDERLSNFSNQHRDQMELLKNIETNTSGLVGWETDIKAVVRVASKVRTVLTVVAGIPIFGVGLYHSMLKFLHWIGDK